MGKAALILSIAAIAITYTVMNSTQNTTLQTQEVSNRASANTLARDLAIKGRQLVLANWVSSEGKASSAPFQSIVEDGGTVTITQYQSVNDILDMTVRAVYDGAVHDIRSRFEWSGFGINPFQVKAADIQFDIDSGTDLEFDEIILDDQSLDELEEVLIDDLNLANDLGDLGLGATELLGELNSELQFSGHTDIQTTLIDQSQREAYESKNGMFFPDQVEQAVAGYIASNPGIETTLADASLLPGSFGTGREVLRIQEDVTIDGSFSGSGILIVEGSFVVPSSAFFSWQGLVIVKPPSSDMNPQLDFSGTVELNGGLIVLHEAMPNSGHMDVTTFRDYSGAWSSSTGVDKKLWYWQWCMYHKHDFTSAYGNDITYFSTSSADRIHEGEIHFYDTLSSLASTDEVFIEVFNHDAHGRGLVTFELQGEDKVSYPIAAGFDPLIANAADPYRTRIFKVSELKEFKIDINRLSSLKKMWDSDQYFPNCSSKSGPLCVGYSHDRQGAMTFRLYQVQSGIEKRIYEASMYWHRRTDEEEAFNDRMDELVSTIQSPDYGLDITLGHSVNISADDAALDMLRAIGGGTQGLTHLGTWQNHWDPTDPTNPKHNQENTGGSDVGGND